MTFEYGWGSIPATDFNVRNGAAKLDTVVAASDSFFVETCTVDQSVWSYNCTSGGAGGSLSLSWPARRQCSRRTRGRPLRIRDQSS